MELKVTALTNHIPAALPPFVSIFKEEIRGHTGKNNTVISCQFVLSLTVLFKRQVIIACLCYDRSIFAYALITAVNIAIRTSGTYLVTTVPRIPYYHNSPLLSNAASSPFYYSIQISRIQALQEEPPEQSLSGRPFFICYRLL
jgi:hypothetical protein